jgi:HSP20 family molecular chaperone IbpA
MRGLDAIENELQNGNLKGGWDVQQIDEPTIKGYVIQGRFWSDQPFEPFNLLKPNNPFQRRPMPQRSFMPSIQASKETREPFTDVFEEDKTVKIYVELPGEKKDDIQLNVTQGKVEVKTKNFYTMIDVPRNVDVGKASSKYNNGVLTILVPKDDTIPNDETRRITID